MKYIEEKIKVFAPVNIIWKAWSDNYIQAGFEVGKKGYVVTYKRGVKFKIEDFKENESLTVIWYSLLVKLVFYHQVVPIDKGSLVICRVKFRGFFSFLIKPLITRKLRKYLQIFLKQFARNLNGV